MRLGELRVFIGARKPEQGIQQQACYAKQIPKLPKGVYLSFTAKRFVAVKMCLHITQTDPYSNYLNVVATNEYLLTLGKLMLGLPYAAQSAVGVGHTDKELRRCAHLQALSEFRRGAPYYHA